MLSTYNARAGLIPKHPTSLDFALQYHSIQPNFLVADIKVNKKYIIIVIFNLYTYYKIVNQIIKLYLLVIRTTTFSFFNGKTIITIGEMQMSLYGQNIQRLSIRLNNCELLEEW